MSKEKIAEHVIEMRQGSLPLNILVDIEQKFFDAVSRGKVKEVESFVKEHPKLNINCVNYQGLTALHTAVKKQHAGVVNLLLQRQDIDLKDVALHAVATGNTEITESILDALNAQLSQSEFSSYEESPEYSKDITPLILAAQCGNFNMIRMLLQRGHTIIRPHLPKCLCTMCKEHISEAAMSLSRIRLNCYKAIANPAYICQATTDPILYAFHMDDEMKNCAYIDKEFRAEYMSLCEDLRTFLVDLISCCRNPSEMEAILHQRTGYKGNPDVIFPRLQLALDYNQKEFVGHSLVQQVLNSVWLDDYKSWNRLSLSEMCLRVILRAFVLPLLAFIIILCPNSRLSQKYQAPVNKFISSLASHLVFVLFIYIMSYRDQTRIARGPPKTGLELLVVIFVLGFVWDSLKQIWIEGCFRYFRAPWHWYDVIMETTFIFTFFFWWKSALMAKHDEAAKRRVLERKYWDSWEPTLIHEGLFAFGCILAFGRLAFYCLQSSRLGPLQVSLGKMAIQIAYFLVFCFLLITSFAVPFTRLYVYYDGMTQIGKDGVTRSQLPSFTTFTNSFGTFFWAMFGMSPKEAVDIVIENLNGDKDNPKLNFHEFTEGVGRFLFSTYQMIMVVALLNTLIAILSNTFQKVVDNADIEWKFARSKLWVYFFHEASALPSPFNLLPTVALLSFFFRYCVVLINKKPGAKAKFSVKRLCYVEYIEEPTDDLLLYETLMTQLVQRYFRAKEEEEEKK